MEGKRNKEQSGKTNKMNPVSWYFDIPVISRLYLTVAATTTALCSLEIISPLSLYFNFKLIVGKGEIWRLFTNFVFFGMPGLDFLFHMYFLLRYCKLLEDNSFRGRTADFLYLLMFGMFSMSLIAPFLNIPFYGSSLTFMMVYIWARRNEHVRMSFLGLFPFQASYLPWVLLSFSLLLTGGSATQSVIVDSIGIVVGHVYFFVDDILPEIARIRGYERSVVSLRAPRFFKALVNSVIAVANYIINTDNADDIEMVENGMQNFMAQ